MKHDDPQRLKALQALTQLSPDTFPHAPNEAAPMVTEMLRSPQTSFDRNERDEEEADLAFPATSSESESEQRSQEDDSPSFPNQAIQPLASFPIAAQASSFHNLRDTRPADLAQRVQQAASATLQLRDQREFKLTLEEDASRDEALVAQLADQTVAIVQQRDEQIYQRVMQAIEQRLRQHQGAFS